MYNTKYDVISTHDHGESTANAILLCILYGQWKMDLFTDSSLYDAYS